MNKRMDKKYVISFVCWLVLTVLAVLTMPNLDELVREKGQVELPPSVQSEVAKSILSRMDDSGETYSVIAVFHSGSEQALSDEQRKQAEAIIHQLQRKKHELGIAKIVSHLDNEQTEKQLVSEDGTTILTQIEVDKQSGTVAEVSRRLYEVVKGEGIRTYLTGNELVIEDFVQSTQQGVKKTELFSVMIIILILILVYWSPIVPLISLLTVGVAYAVSLGIVAHLVHLADFPFSNFTQVFLVVVLFGIGTDYNILLYSRFKEELSRQERVLAAVKQTFRTAGKTVLYSGTAVFIGFAVLFLADFKLYRSGSAVAVGVGVLLLVLVTLNPFFMALLGKAMFWPLKRFEGHGENRLWMFLSRQSAGRPFASLLLVLLVCLPLLLQYSNTSSFNDLWEVDDAFASKQGIQVIEEHFPPGFSSPATLVIRAKQPLDNQASLQLLDELAEKVSRVEGVAEVYSPTRPAGEKIAELYLRDQAETLHDGLREADSGLREMKQGFSSAEKDMAAGSGGDLAHVRKLVDGTGALRQGVAALEEAVRRLADGFRDGAAGAGELEAGLREIQDKVGALSSAVSQLRSGYGELAAGFRSLGEQVSLIRQTIAGAKAAFEQTETALTALMQAHPELAGDRNVQTVLGTAQEGKRQLAELAGRLEQWSQQYGAAVTAFQEANASLTQVDEGLSRLHAGVGQLQSGASQLHAGLQTGVSGSRQMAGKIPVFAAGLKQIQEGQQQLLNGLKDLETKRDRLRSGLSQSTEGLTEISKGLQEAQDYLASLRQSPASERFYVPEEALNGDEVQEALDMYLSDDRKTAQMTVILDVNPYSQEAMSIIQRIEEQAKAALSGTDLREAELAIAGKASQNADLKEMSGQDFVRTMALMLAGIGLVLVVITRSVLQPLAIIASLGLAYGTSLGLTELLLSHLFGIEKLGWNVPFFSFVMIVALGVDYSIFLMMRYREVAADAMQAIVEACTRTGSVVISAAVILGGTFAALYPSGVLTLIEVATVVIIGLMLLSLVMLPVFIPAVTVAVSKLNMWSYKMKFKTWKESA